MPQIFLFTLMIFCLQYIILVQFGRSVEGNSNMGNHIAKILWNGKNNKWSFLCTGSIVENSIKKNYSLIVTLARCLYSPEKEIWTDTPEEVKKFKILVGFGTGNTSMGEYTASNIYVHPCFGNAKKDEAYSDVYDIAVIRLSSRIDLEQKIASSIILPNFNQDMSGSFIADKNEYNILGFPGSEKGSEKEGLRLNEVSILNKTECSKFLEKIFPINHPGREMFICVNLHTNKSGSNETKDPQCPNNRGSSVYIKQLYTNENNKRTYNKTLLGLGGYTENCEKKDNQPGLFVDISKYSCYVLNGKWPLDCTIPKSCDEGVSIWKYDLEPPKNRASLVFNNNCIEFYCILLYYFVFILK